MWIRRSRGGGWSPTDGGGRRGCAEESVHIVRSERRRGGPGYSAGDSVPKNIFHKVLMLSTSCPGCVHIVYLVSRLSMDGWVLRIYSLILFGHEFWLLPPFISVPKLFGSRQKWQSNQVLLKNGLKATTMGPREQFVLCYSTGSCHPVRSSPLHIIYYPPVFVLVVFQQGRWWTQTSFYYQGS